MSVRVTLPQDTAGTLELRVQDSAGNVVRHTVAATVDVVPPGGTHRDVARWWRARSARRRWT